MSETVQRFRTCRCGAQMNAGVTTFPGKPWDRYYACTRCAKEAWFCAGGDVVWFDGPPDAAQFVGYMRRGARGSDAA